MSTTLSGLIALENPMPSEDSPSTISFDGQMWLSPSHILIGIFHYYYSLNISFPDIGQYFVWIHVRNRHFQFFHSLYLLLNRSLNTTLPYLSSMGNRPHSLICKSTTYQKKTQKMTTSQTAMNPLTLYNTMTSFTLSET